MNRILLTTVALILMALPAAELPAQNVQSNTIPGRFAITAQPLPPLASIIAKAVPDRPVYGLYTWAGEYRSVRDEIRKVGWKQIRVGGPWADADMRMAVEDDMEVLMTLGRKKRSEYASDDAFIADHIRLIDTFLTRYGPGGSFFADNPGLPVRPVTAVEVWNEPNFQYMIPDREPRAEVEHEREALYEKLLPTVYQAIKTKWPDVRIVGFSTGGSSAGDLRFIANVWKQNPELISRSFDIFSTHPYVDPVPPEADAVRSWGSYSIAKSLSAILNTTGSASPVWYTEVGWPVSKADGGYFPTKAGEPMVNPQLQAAYVCRMYSLALRLGVERVHIMFATDTDDFNAGFFLRDKTWRPSAYAVQTMIKVMPFPKLIGAINDGNDGWYAWTFHADARFKTTDALPVTMAFNVAGAKHVELPWPAPAATVTDMLGATRQTAAVQSSDGKWMLPVDIGPCPVYLTPAQTKIGITPSTPADLTVTVASTQLRFDPPEIREMKFDAKAPRNFASWYEPWEPWPAKGLDNSPNTIDLKPAADEEGTLILGGLFRMVIPESVIVTSADSSKTFKLGEDYQFNADWAQIANLNSRLGEEWKAELKISCQYAMQRLDLIQVDADGDLSVKKGTSKIVCPVLPEADTGCTALAGVYIAPWKQKKTFAITAENIYRINPEPPVQPVNKDAIAAVRQKLADGQNVKIAFVGDSITLGAEAGNWWADLWTEKNSGYASRVVTGLKKLFPRATITPIAACQGATTTQYGLGVIEKTVLPANPDLVFISFGGNDAGGAIGEKPRNPPDQFKEDLRVMIRKAKAADADVILVVTMQQNPWQKNKVTERWPVYRQAMLELAGEENVGVADCYTEWENQASHGIPPFSQLHNCINHPGKDGHKLFADVVLRFFE